jgi:hypothetical protein
MSRCANSRSGSLSAFVVHSEVMILRELNIYPSIVKYENYFTIPNHKMYISPRIDIYFLFSVHRPDM